jgi:hypothetical protein
VGALFKLEDFKMIIENVLLNISLNDKAKFLNFLIRKQFPGTQDVSKLLLSNVAKEFENVKVRQFIESGLWEWYGLHYKDYISITPGKGFDGQYFDPFKAEKEIDTSIIYYLDLLSQRKK